MTDVAHAVPEIEKTAISKIRRRIIPLCIVLYIVNLIDRSNIGFAALDMNADLGISATQFGSLTSMFFIGYFLVEVPSNMLLHKFGARIWMARIMLTWGLVTCIMFFAQSFLHVAILRVLLGIAEAGFFPGMIYFFTFWFPQRYRASITALFFVAFPISGIIGAPLATWIMRAIGWGGFAGWRWLFMIEGLFAILGGIACLLFLSNSPKEVKWLTSEEKDYIQNKIAEEDKNKTGAHGKFSLKKIFSNSRVWRLAFIYMFIQTTTQTFQFWSPSLVKEFSTAFSNTTVGYLMMIPPALGIVGMLYWGRRSDQTGERKWHTAIPMLVFAAAMAIIAFAPNIELKIFGLALTGLGMYTYYGPYWAVPTLALTGESAAVGVAIINSMSSFGGFSGNIVVGVIKDSPAGTHGVFIFQMACAFVAFLLMVTLKLRKEGEQQEPKVDAVKA